MAVHAAGGVTISLGAALSADAISRPTDSGTASHAVVSPEAGSGAVSTGMAMASGLGRCFGRTHTTIYLATSSGPGRSTIRFGRMADMIFLLGSSVLGTATTHWPILTASSV